MQVNFFRWKVSFAFLYISPSHFHIQVMDDVIAWPQRKRVFAQFLLCFLSFLLACLLACPCDVSAILWVWKLKFGAISEDVLWQKRYFNYFFDESINWWITLIIIDLFMTYLFSFSSEQAVWHLDIWARKLIFGHDSEEVIWL